MSIFLIHNRRVEEEMVEVICELSIALCVLKERIPYKYTVFSPRSALVDNPYEFIHNTPQYFRPGYANRTLCVPKELLMPEGTVCIS